MILLGINCGLGNGDCGNLPLRALDLGHGWVDFPRPKTGIPRRGPLRPETVEAQRGWPRPARFKRDGSIAPGATTAFAAALPNNKFGLRYVVPMEGTRTLAVLLSTGEDPRAAAGP